MNTITKKAPRRIARPGTRPQASAVLLAAVLVLLPGCHKRQAADSSGSQLAATTGQSVNYQDSNHHFSLTAPPAWRVQASAPLGQSALTLIEFLDPATNCTSTLTVWRGSARPNASVRDWAEWEVAAGARMGKKDGTLRPNSWAERVVAGSPAVSLLTDYSVGGSKYVIYHVYAINGKTSMKFRFMIPAGDFAGLKPVLVAMLDSCKVE